MRLPKSIQNLIESFEKLPGIGPKTAQRLTFYLLNNPETELQKFSESLLNLKGQTKVCEICHNVDEVSPCSICSDEKRDHSRICVVETPLDVLALETADFKGLYHVLGGAISPLNNIGAEDLYIDSLQKRLRREIPVSEIIIATNPNLEGEATAMYIQKLLQNMGTKITRIGHGLPVGGDLEYADSTTLKRALEGRREF